MVINGREFRQFRDYPYYVDMNGFVYSLHTQSFINPRIHKSSRSKTDYYQIALYKDTIRLDIALHIIVAECWIPNLNKLPQVNHKDGNGLNCCSNNLEWCTQSYNTKHAFDTGLNMRRYGVIQYTMDMIKIKTFDSALDAQNQTGIANASINHVCRGHRQSAGGFRWKFA